MDQFNKLYNILMEQLNSAILAPTHGSTGGALQTTDSYATDNLQRPEIIGQYTRKGKLKTSKSKKRK
jgi:hypothetical protein